MVDGRVRLDDLVDREPVGSGDPTLKRAHDSGGDGALEAEGIADRNDRVADVDRVGIAERQRPESARLRVDLEDGDVRGGIAPDHLGVHAVLAGEVHLDLARAFDHVVVRDDVAGVVDDEARPARARLLRPEKGIVGGDLGRDHLHDAAAGLSVDLRDRLALPVVEGGRGLRGLSDLADDGRSAVASHRLVDGERGTCAEQGRHEQSPGPNEKRLHASVIAAGPLSAC